jgi:glyoxylase-like metal-dependent hydrolase (beta-lactamase superfamily II)
MAPLPLLILLLTRGAADAREAPGDLRLYTLDCGSASLADGGVASDTGELDRQPLELSDPCFLIRHPHGSLLWDAGLGLEPPSLPGIRYQLAAPIEEQLAGIGLQPSAITLLAFSHLHFDHVGAASRFPRATSILERAELAWGSSEPPHVSMFPELFSGYRRTTTQLIDGDHDVFGDGRVRILSAPGHTPGSAVLYVDLRNGPVLLSGDLYISRSARRHQYIPSTNASRAETLASMARIERWLQRTHARLIIQHDPQDYAGLPKLPRYLD